MYACSTVQRAWENSWWFCVCMCVCVLYCWYLVGKHTRRNGRWSVDRCPRSCTEMGHREGRTPHMCAHCIQVGTGSGRTHGRSCRGHHWGTCQACGTRQCHCGSSFPGSQVGRNSCSGYSNGHNGLHWHRDLWHMRQWGSSLCLEIGKWMLLVKIETFNHPSEIWTF